jgi:hypothetical protein
VVKSLSWYPESRLRTPETMKEQRLCRAYEVPRRRRQAWAARVQYLAAGVRHQLETFGQLTCSVRTPARSRINCRLPRRYVPCKDGVSSSRASFAPEEASSYGGGLLPPHHKHMWISGWTQGPALLFKPQIAASLRSSLMTEQTTLAGFNNGTRPTKRWLSVKSMRLRDA